MKNDIEETDASPAQEEPNFGRKLSEADWAEAVNLYELGKAGTTELADRFGCTRQNLSNRFRAAGVKRASRAHELTEAATEASKRAAEEAAASEQRFSNRRAEMIEETRMNGLAALKQARVLAQKTVVEAVKAKKPLSSTDDDLKAIQRFNKVLGDNILVSLQVLRADEHVDDDDLPTLIVANLTDEEILAHHKSTGALPEDASLDDLNLQDDYQFEEV